MLAFDPTLHGAVDSYRMGIHITVSVICDMSRRPSVAEQGNASAHSLAWGVRARAYLAVG